MANPPAGSGEGEGRAPRGYRGVAHETIGSDLLAVVRSLQALTSSERGVAGVIGAAEVKRLASIDPNGWYPIGWLIELFELVDTRVGRFGLLRLGRTLFSLSHEQRVREQVRSGRDLVFGIDAMYRHANRGQEIGGWSVLHFDEHGAELEKTTPHHCAVEEGILSQAFEVVGAPAVVTQSACFRQGAAACRFVITPTSSRSRWSGV